MGAPAARGSEEGVEAPDVVEAQECEHRQAAFMARSIGSQQLAEILDHCLRCATRAAGEKDQSSGALRGELRE